MDVNSVINLNSDIQEEFLEDIKLGFSNPDKFIPSRYLYDKVGSELYNKVTHNTEYYLTACEMEIFHNHSSTISDFLVDNSLDIVELGPGEGIKTSLLLKEMSMNSTEYQYYPIDISRSYLEDLQLKFKKNSNINITPIQGDFIHGLKWLSQHSNRNKIVLFLGSSIGHMNNDACKSFLDNIKECLNPGDYLLLGYDLLKDKNTLLKAYNDDAKNVRDFILNLIYRINNELKADININNFSHFPTYNEQAQAVENFILSNKDQQIKIDGKFNFGFTQGELIHATTSRKFTPQQINEQAENSGFDIIKTYTDSRNFFVDSLWRYN